MRGRKGKDGGKVGEEELPLLLKTVKLEFFWNEGFRNWSRYDTRSFDHSRWIAVCGKRFFPKIFPLLSLLATRTVITSHPRQFAGRSSSPYGTTSNSGIYEGSWIETTTPTYRVWANPSIETPSVLFLLCLSTLARSVWRRKRTESPHCYWKVPSIGRKYIH